MVAAIRSRLTEELGDSPPTCGDGLVCKEVALKEYDCVDENATGRNTY